MRKKEKIWFIMALLLVAIGAILFTGAMTAYDWDFTQLSTVSYEKNTYEASCEFDRISIHVDTTKIELLPADDQRCSIVCYESEKEKHTVSMQNGTLEIEVTDTRKWYEHIGISFGGPKMTVYLPQKQYASLLIETDTGDISIPKDFSFESIEIDGDTSDVDCFASVSGKMEIEVSTGRINIEGITAGQLDLTTSTGNIQSNSVTIKNDIELETDTGEILLKKTVASGKLSVESSTGDVRFEDSDAATIAVETDTGDVTGTLLSEKIFMTETSTGKIRVPKTTSGGKCEIKTSTGDIKMDIKL